MWVERLRLTNFRNYAELTLKVGPAPIVLTGPSGAGKTNLLDAVSLLSAGQGLRREREALRRAVDRELDPHDGGDPERDAGDRARELRSVAQEVAQARELDEQRHRGSAALALEAPVGQAPHPVGDARGVAAVGDEDQRLAERPQHALEQLAIGSSSQGCFSCECSDGGA